MDKEAAFTELSMEIEERMRRLDMDLAGLRDADPTWPLIGSLGYINEQLGELEKFIRPVAYNA